jgi:hypothetical protein
MQRLQNVTRQWPVIGSRHTLNNREPAFSTQTNSGELQQRNEVPTQSLLRSSCYYTLVEEAHLLGCYAVWLL